MARATVFGAGAMGTAVAMHLSRAGHRTVLWAGPTDRAVLPALLDDRRHPALPEHLPEALAVLGPDDLPEAAGGVEVAVMGANSSGARPLARLVVDRCGSPPLVVGIAKGLEPVTGRRMSEVYAEEAGHGAVVSVGGPALAPEVAMGFQTAAVFGSLDPAASRAAAAIFRTRSFQVHITDDVVGLEYCTVAKNVAAIGLGILDGMGKLASHEYRNAKAALFTLAFQELVELVVSLGGRAETATGPAGLGDMLVTSLGGRNRLYGELLGEGLPPPVALAQLEAKGMTVEGVESTADVDRLAGETGLRLPYLTTMNRILFEGAPAASVIDCLRGADP